LRVESSDLRVPVSSGLFSFRLELTTHNSQLTTFPKEV
jgi:hypothetical protein